VPLAERAATGKDLRKEFHHLPLKQKLTTLVEFEAVTMFETLDAIISVPFTIGEKVLNLIAGRGRALNERDHKAGRPAERSPHEEKASSDVQG
jgi:hypothetical protein